MRLLTVLLAILLLSTVAAEAVDAPSNPPIILRRQRLPPPPGMNDAPAPPAADPNAPTVHGQLRSFTPDTFGALFGIMAHEFGHYMIGELKIPATGPEEDVADEFAAMVFIDNMKEAPDAAVAMALGDAKLWWFMADDRGDNATPFYDEHAPDRARFAKFSCMLYGAAPDKFDDLMNAAGIPERTKKRCVTDEAKHHAAWDALLRPFRRRGVAPNIPGDLDPATPGHTIEVVYEEPRDPAIRPYAEELRKSGVFEYIAYSISKLYALPRDTKLVFRNCGVENCFYTPNDGSVTMCWEMINFVINEFRKHGEGVPSPEQNGGGAPTDIDQFMIGKWQSQFTASGVTERSTLLLAPHGIYQLLVQMRTQTGEVTAITVQGTWSVTPGNVGVQLSLNPQQWFPPQICQAGTCTALNPTPRSITIQIVDQNTLSTAEGKLTRVQ